jgi:predicted thioesterase
MATSEVVAARFGNVDVDVLATPYLIWLLEGASVRAVKDHLTPSERTVGTAVNVRHERAAPAGVEVTARARLTEVDGRRLVFAVEALARGERLMSGTHERMVVHVERFLLRAKRERPAGS